MNTIKKYSKIIILISALAVFGVGAGSVLAQETLNTQDTSPAVEIKDIGISDKNIGTLPTSSWYFFKEWGRGVKMFFTFNPVAKAALELNIANEKAAEAVKVSENSSDEKIDKALKNYEDAAVRLKDKLGKLSQDSSNPNVKKLIENVDDKIQKHAILFDQIAEKKKDFDWEKLQDKIQGTITVAAGKNKDVKAEAQKAIEEAKKLITLLENEWQGFAINEPGLKEANPKVGSTQDLLDRSKEHLKRAKEAFDDGKYGEAYGLATAAKVQAANALRRLNKIDSFTIKQKTASQSNEGNQKGAVCGDGRAPACPDSIIPSCKDGTWICVKPSSGIKVDCKAACQRRCGPDASCLTECYAGCRAENSIK